jgi:mannose/fructose/N-acetylgalactosamine-specific phosphotransferase system component IIB
MPQSAKLVIWSVEKAAEKILAGVDKGNNVMVIVNSPVWLKGLQDKGKKVSSLDVSSVKFIEPLHKPEDDVVPVESEAENVAGEIDNSDVEDPIDIDIDEDTQLTLF